MYMHDTRYNTAYLKVPDPESPGINTLRCRFVMCKRSYPIALFTRPSSTLGFVAGFDGGGGRSFGGSSYTVPVQPVGLQEQPAEAG